MRELTPPSQGVGCPANLLAPPVPPKGENHKEKKKEEVRAFPCYVNADQGHTGWVMRDSKCFRVLVFCPTSHTVTLPFPPAAVTRKGESGQNEAAKIFPY